MRRLLDSARGRLGRRGDQRGFTLIELLMGIILASVFAVALYGFFFAGLDAFRTHESQARAQSNGRTALNQMERDLRQ
jgi:prepilin-type N-terminal cleavage/methylation domain-containing protein